MAFVVADVTTVTTVLTVVVDVVAAAAVVVVVAACPALKKVSDLFCPFNLSILHLLWEYSLTQIGQTGPIKKFLHKFTLSTLINLSIFQHISGKFFISV